MLSFTIIDGRGLLINPSSILYMTDDQQDSKIVLTTGDTFCVKGKVQYHINRLKGETK